MINSVYKTILIEDEAPALKRLERMLTPYHNIIEIVDTAENGTDAVEKINTQKPDLIFLDIKMPELTGFEVLEKLNYLPLVIFSTAYDKYALKAFETNSIDYLLKPISKERLDSAIEKLKRITDSSSNEIKANISELLSKVMPGKIKRIQVKIGDKVKFIETSEIYFFKADNKYVELYTYDKKYLINDPLSSLEANLPDDFVRVHRSVIINMIHTDELFKVSKNLYNIKLKDKHSTVLPVSRNMKSKLSL